MDRIEKELKAKYRKHLSEGDVISFADRKKAREPSVTDKVASVFADFPNQLANQETAEAQARAWARRLMTEGESSKKKWYIPFVMKNYVEGTHPIWAIVYELEGYLDDMANNEYTKEQMRFLHEFITKHRSEMIKAIEVDMAQGMEYIEKIKEMDIPLVPYALRPLESAMFHAGSLKSLKEKLIEFHRYGGIFVDPNSQFAHRSFVMLRKLKEDIETQMTRPFDRTTTGLPYYDDMLRMPDYFQDAKGIVFLIMDMSPDEYIARAQKGFEQHHNYRGNIMDTRTERLAREYAQKMLDGETFPMPYLDYTNLSFEQEGLHRAWAAKMAGVDKMPVMVLDNTAEQKEKIRNRKDWW